MGEKNFDDKSYDLKEECIVRLAEFLKMILLYTNEVKKNYNVELTEKDGLSKDVVFFLNHLESDVHLTKENILGEIANLFDYKEKDVSLAYQNFGYTIERIYNDEELIYEFMNYNEDKEFEFNFQNYIDLPNKIPKIVMCWIKSTEKDLQGFLFPQICGSSLFLDEAINVSGVKFPVVVLNGFYANNVKIAQNTKFPKIIFGGFLVDNIESAVSVTWPVFVDGNYNIGYLKSAKGLNLPYQIVNGDLILGMTSDEDLDLPKYVDGYVIMPDLVEVKHLELPLSCEGVEFDSLENVDGLIIPDPLTYEIKCKNLTITPQNVSLHRNESLKWTPNLK